MALFFTVYRTNKEQSEKKKSASRNIKLNLHVLQSKNRSYNKIDFIKQFIPKT